MIAVATILLVAALPLLLWPLLKPAEDQAAEANISASESASPAPAQLAVEDIRLDLATGRIDQAEADRRIGELRIEATGRSN